MRAMEYEHCIQECECVELDDLHRVVETSSSVSFAPTRLTHGCPIHGRLAEIQSRQKHLTDAECAAEYWRAEADEQINFITNEDDAGAVDAYQHIRGTWHRFATHPHASEACPHCGGGPWRHVRDLPNGSVIVQCRECKAATDLKGWAA